MDMLETTIQNDPRGVFIADDHSNDSKKSLNDDFTQELIVKSNRRIVWMKKKSKFWGQIMKNVYSMNEKFTIFSKMIIKLIEKVKLLI